jgi:hypothetical protein
LGPDSQHDPAHFICGTAGTEAEHEYRMESSFGACGFIGLWHTHPDLLPKQSGEDIDGMARLVARAGQNRRRALMLIFGRRVGAGAAGVYVYEGLSATREVERITVGVTQLALAEPVV